ncbi:MAG TPA: glycosyltransferase [Candidatus Dormibacteraeota bacterium]
MSTVSAVVVCYNHARFLREALRSVDAQSRRPDQVVVIDDASTDGSQGLIREWAAASGLNPTVILHAENRGPCPTFNEALRLVDGDLIAALAADDYWLPDKLRLQADVLDAAPAAVGVVYSDVPIVDELGQTVAESFLNSYDAPSPRPAGAVFESLLDHNFVPGPGAMYRRACVDEVGYLDERLQHEDWDFWLRIAAHFEFAYLDADVARYRRVAGSLVGRIAKSAYVVDYLRTLDKLSAERLPWHDAVRRKLLSLASELCAEGGSDARWALRLRIKHETGPRKVALALVTLYGLVPPRVLNQIRKLKVQRG